MDDGSEDLPDDVRRMLDVLTPFAEGTCSAAEARRALMAIPAPTRAVS